MFNKQIETVKRTVRNNKPALIIGAALGVAVTAYATKDMRIVMLPKANTYFEATPQIKAALAAGTAVVYETTAGNYTLYMQK